MPEERLALAGDPPSSRNATVSEERRTYMWHLAWQRSRHGRGLARRRMKAPEIARSTARFLVARRRCHRPMAREGITERRLNEELEEREREAHEEMTRWLNEEPEEREQIPLPTGLSDFNSDWDLKDWGILPLKRQRSEENITSSSLVDADVKRPRLGAHASQAAGDDREQTSDSSEDYSEDTPTKMDVPMAIEGSTCSLALEEPVTVAVKTAGEITGKESITQKCPAEEPVMACAEIVSAQRGVEVTMAGEITVDESSIAEGGLEKPMVGQTEAEIALAKRWLPLPYPDFPRTGKLCDFIKYTNESKRIREINNQGFDRTKKLPYFALKPDKETSAAVKSSTEKKDICQKAGQSVAAVSSSGPGQDNATVYFSGTVTECPGGRLGWVRVVTSSAIMYDNDGNLRSPNQKVYVKLANDQKYEANVLFVNKHYEFAVLEVCVRSSMPTLSFGSMPRNGQRLTVLGRDSECMFLRAGFVSTLELTSPGRTHYMVLEPECENEIPLIATGGPVIDDDGAMVALITCHIRQTAMLTISIVQSCLDMWEKHGCIARPKISMNLRTVKNLSVEIRDKMQGVYQIQRGFIVDGVEFDSTPEKVGIRKGDVVEILDEGCGSTLPELETYLLSHGLKFLPKVTGTSTEKLELKIRVHDLAERTRTNTRVALPLVYE